MPCACGRSVESLIRSTSPSPPKIKLNITRNEKIKILRNFYLSRTVDYRNSKSFKIYFVGLCRRVL